MKNAERRLGDEALADLVARIGCAAAPAYIKDGELRFLSASDGFCRIFGGDPQELIDGTSPAAVSRELDEAERRCLVFGKDQRVCIQDGEGARHVLALTRFQLDDGSMIVVAHDPAIAVGDLPEQAEPAPVRSGSAAKDVLTLSEETDLESVIGAMPMGVVLTDSDLNVELVNQPFFDIWKVIKREDLVGRNFRALIDINRHNGIYDVADSDWEGYVAQRLSEIAAGHIAPREFVRADGVVLMYSVTPLSGGQRMICYYDVTDIEDQKRQLEATTREAERVVRLLDDATEAMAQGLLIYDDENIVYTNARFHEFLGVPKERVVPGQPWWDYIEYCAARGDYGSPEEARKACDYIRDSHRNRLFHQMERRGQDGRWLRIDGKPTAGGLTVVTYSDISELKTREAELEDLVVKAEASDRAKSEFLANMSHEIRTPMNGVLGMAELLSKTDLDTRQRTYCDIVVKSGNALLTIINDILDFSKIEAGEISLDSSPFDLREAVEDVAGLMATAAREKDLELAVSIEPDLPQTVRGDPGRFRQVMTNLVGNAVKFTEKGHVLIEVGGHAIDGGLDLTIAITDTGLGIPADKLERIFDKFSQVDGSSTRRHEGTGLGLAITSRLAALMGGRILVESEEGSGSTFTVKLRLGVHGEERIALPRRDDVQGARILVVDDNEINRNILLDQLNGWGCDACAAVSAQEGLAFLGAAVQMRVPVDCMILDHHMPVMTGLEMARQLRATPEIAATPIVLLTSVDVDPHTEDIASLKLAAWLTKPARSQLLLDTLCKVVVARPAENAAPAAAKPARELEKAAPASSAGTEQVPDDSELDLWIDNENLAESVAGLREALSFEDATDHDGAHVDRQLERLPQSAGQALIGSKEHQLDILVAEDNEVNQIVFSQILDDLDVVYRIVENGALAVEAFVKSAPRLILMDVSMPVMNGHQATRAIREKETPADRRVPIIGITAHALKGDREACIEAGMDDYLSKPISPEKLEAKVRQWLGVEDEKLRDRA